MLTEILRTGAARGGIEVRQNVTLIFNYLFFPSIALIVMYFLRGVSIDGGGSVALYAIPGILAMNVLFTGLMGLATTLMMEREDGTLLRARSVPNGIRTYLVGKLLGQVAFTVSSLIVVIVLAAVLFDGFLGEAGPRVLHLIWLLPLGMLATLPFGAVLGSVLPSPRHLSFVSLGLMGLVAISGVFYPMDGQPMVAHVIGQCFPLSWMGMGMRSALLAPEAGVTVGAGGELIVAAGALGLWSAVGTGLATVVLRRTAQRQAGTKLARKRG